MSDPMVERLLGAARPRIWAGIEAALPADVLLTDRELINRIVDEILLAFTEVVARSELGHRTVHRLNRLGEQASLRVSWSLLDAVILEILSGVIEAAETGYRMMPSKAARWLTQVTNRFFDGFWVFEDGAAVEQAVRFGRLADILPMPVFITDYDGKLTFVNDAFEDLFGEPGKQIVGVHMEEFLGREILSGELPERIKVGQGQRYVEAHVLEVPTERGSEHFGILLDRSHEVALERARDKVVATISHELRTPLTVVVGYLDLLTEDLDELRLDSATSKDALEVMKQEANLLVRLVDDLIDVTGLETGARDLRLSTFQLNDAVTTAIRRADATDAVLMVPEIKVRLDRERIEQVLSNLLANARRYGGERYGLDAVSLPGGSLQIRVWDNGSGIPEADRSRIFETFVQGHASPGIGSGIGLAVCRAITRAHGGDIVLEDRPGASFLATLPDAVV